MIDAKFAPYGALVLRVTTGALFVYHGLLKLLVFTPAGAAGFFDSIGLPGWLAYLTMTAEILGGGALILGIATQLVSAALVPVLLGAALFAHRGAGFGWTNPGGGMEFPLMWAAVQASLALIGDGAHALYPLRRT
ncbi:DoxX family protein [Thalassobius sp. S69A]|uniref:DoxX family protein n=1 Tax=unclassified Thalassovita TaxID=2619711 RepID=UPI000C0E2606|nr:LysR family transcriptional regulator [Paracoccaceae bacterium]MBT25478.1 LysR family transcriptional regulator [Paracoccaceae bacterium]|tara:strand:- start:10 stop:414 length:405 start_codon:yes stop_codon:yes gene_type:complete